MHCIDKRNDQAQCWLVKQIWLAAYQIISQWAQTSWNLTSNNRGSLLGFSPSRNLNSSVYWRNRVGDHMPNYEQPYIYSPTVFSHCFHYNRKLCQSCSRKGSSSKLSSLILLQGESLLFSPSPSKSVELLSLIILPAFSKHLSDFSCSTVNNSPSQQLSFKSLVLVWLFHELFSLSSQQKSIQSSTRFLAGKQWTKRGRSILSSTNWVSLSLMKQ